MDGWLAKQMPKLCESRTKRLSSWDRTGGNLDFISISPHGKAILGEIAGAGCLNHIYFGTCAFADRHYLRKVLLRMYWDREERPSVDVPLGDFFGLGHCRMRAFKSLVVCVNKGVFNYAMNAYFPMPFSDGAKIELVNEGEEAVPQYWYHIDYEECDNMDRNMGRFHAQWRRENPCLASEIHEDEPLYSVTHATDEGNYIILDAEGRGHLVGLFLNVDNIAGGWWGEGDDMIFVDGERWPPSLHGTGTEEIFGGGGCPNEEYDGPYTGFHLISSPDWRGKNSMYRFYLNDPVNFQKSLKVSIEHGHANNLANDYSSTAFWYQSEPHKPFPKMLAPDERVPRETTQFLNAMKKENAMYTVLLDLDRAGVVWWEKKEIRSLLVEMNASLDNDDPRKASRKIRELTRILIRTRRSREIRERLYGKLSR